MGTTRIYSEPLENAHRCLLSLFLALSLAQFFHLIPRWGMGNTVVKFLTLYVFFNSTHIIFTAIMLFSFPEFKSWLRLTLKSRRALTLLLVFGVIVYCGILSSQKMTEGQATFVAVIVLCLGGIHKTSQIKGLSLMYNANHLPKLDASERVVHARVESVERYLFNAFIAMAVLNQVDRGDLVDFGKSVRWVFLVLSLLMCAGILLNSFRYPKIHLSNKRFYLTSCVLAAFGSYVGFTWVYHRALHGIEYAFLCFDMMKRSAVSRTPRWWLGAILTVAAFSFLALVAHRFIPRASMPKSILPTILALHFFCEFSHYYLDGLLFRFSDANVKRHLAKVVMPGQGPEFVTAASVNAAVDQQVEEVAALEAVTPDLV